MIILDYKIFDVQALTAAAGKLSNPLTKKVEEFSLKEPSLAPGKKPWQQIVEERVQAKTRLISKVMFLIFIIFCILYFIHSSFPFSFPQGSKKLEAVPNQFNDVCGQFFFPLISHFEANKIPTLDLQGRDRYCNVLVLMYTIYPITHIFF